MGSTLRFLPGRAKSCEQGDKLERQEKIIDLLLKNAKSFMGDKFVDVDVALQEESPADNLEASQGRARASSGSQESNSTAVEQDESTRPSCLSVLNPKFGQQIISVSRAFSHSPSPPGPTEASQVDANEHRPKFSVAQWSAPAMGDEEEGEAGEGGWVIGS